MNTQFVRKAIYLAISTLLIVGSLALVTTSFNVQTARASSITQEGGGGGMTIYEIISMQLAAKHVITIRTTTTVNNVDTYIVQPQIGTSYYASKLGTEYICVIRAADVKKTQTCIPFTAIATISFRE